MINLLEQRDFFQRQDGKMDMHNHFDAIIRGKLREGLTKHRFIYTQKLRGIGKTYEIIAFAKSNNLNVVVMSGREAKILRDKYNYDKIYSQEDKCLNIKECIVDECVNIDLLRQKGIKILTGFSEKEDFELSSLPMRIKCKECNGSLEKDKFYILDTKYNGKIFIPICKECIEEKYKNEDLFIKICHDYNILFINDIYMKTNSVDEYFKYIALPQYKYFTFKDSIFEKEKLPISNDLVLVLENEVQQLIIKIKKAREEENYGTYKNLITSLSELLRLKEKEEDKLKQ